MFSSRTYVNKSNNTLELCGRGEDFGAESRYFFDSLLLDVGFRQFDTSQDASYFGVWINKSTGTMVTYAEGDVTVTYCPSDKAYRAELKDMCAFHRPGCAFKTIGPEGITEYYEDRTEFER